MDHLVSRLLGGAALIGALASGPAFGQSAPVVSRPVVQAIPGADNKKLSMALARLGRDARDVPALIDAGDAARALQDYAAAIGFYRRADEVSPGNPGVQAGLGSAFVHNGDPVSAIPCFDAAEKAGAAPSAISADRGLAYDLVGDNALAQRYYAAAMATASGDKADELRNRLAVSQAIGGDLDAAYATLLPLLNKQDKPGWRTRAFTLAIAGDTDQAVDVAGKILPGQLAQNIAPYLRYMPRLTKAQQSAAANLGRFPKASEIGRDDARIAAYAPPRSTAAGAGLIPKGEPLGGTKLANAGKTARPRVDRAGRQQGAARSGAQSGSAAARTAALASVDPDRVAPPDPKPTIERDGSGELPPIGRSAEAPKAAATVVPSSPTPARQPARSSKAPQVAAASASPVRTAPAATSPSGPAANPGFDLGRLPAATSAANPAAAEAAKTPPAAPQVAAAASPPPVPGPSQLSLSEIFADIGKPTADIMPASGAVDIRLITPAAPPPPPAPAVQLPKVDEGKPAEPTAAELKAAKAKDARAKAAAAKAAEAKAKAEAEAKAKAKKPSHPSRIWVQIGVGRDKGAIAFDWRRYTRENAALLKGYSPYVSEMGRTNRVLIGPFATQKAANSFLADAKRQGFSDALPWTSPAGQVVDPLSAK
ncbi:SPOR domain-containing protein [Novosphingobium guangzhouense]|uniref:SPOR domain-containing protein n=1 Tax=Novosphingobium guangzhouense TaxID=1850347 RepID=UPI001FE958A8|nr:SPOR domain-containing protein [Novosphingobium guangzhouense]